MTPHPAPEEPDGGRPRWWARLRDELRRVVREAVHSALGQTILLGIGAALALSGSGFGFVRDLPVAVVVAPATLGIALVVPMAILFARSRQRRALQAVRDERDEALDLVAQLGARLEEAHGHEEARAEVDQMVADLFAVLLGGDDVPAPAWVRSSLDFERWLNDFSREIVQVVLRDPGEPPGLAIIRRREARYEIAHRTAHVPREIVRLDGRPAHRDLEECLRDHAPEAVVLYARDIDEDSHWVVVFPSREIDLPFLEASLKALAEIVIAAYRRRLAYA